MSNRLTALRKLADRLTPMSNVCFSKEDAEFLGLANYCTHADLVAALDQLELETVEQGPPEDPEGLPAEDFYSA